MPLIISVPPNTMLADLDELLRTLLRKELGRHGFDGVEIAFEAPAREWSGQLSAPTVNLFLYDLREAPDRRPVEWSDHRGENGRARETRPPMIMECSYAVTAWTQDVEDEHRLLSQVLAVLFAFPELPTDAMGARLAAIAARHSIEGRIGQAKSDGKADFWNAVGGKYKASLDYVVTIACESGTVVERGPEVRAQTITTRLKPGGKSTVTELHRFGGTVTGEDGRPAVDAWIALPDLGLLASSDAAGRFTFDGIGAGTHQLVARTASGGEAKRKIRVPGDRVDLVLAPRKAPRRRD